MKGKVGFVLGAALGYVLGTRAGRARYEQIKRGANAVWETPLVQQGVSGVKGSVGEGMEVVKSAAFQLAKNVFDAAAQKPSRNSASQAAPSEARSTASRAATDRQATAPAVGSEEKDE